VAGKSAFSGLLGDPTQIGRQLLVWQVLGTILGDLMDPIMQQVLDEVWPIVPSRPLSVADVAEMRLKNIVSEDEAQAEAKRTGYDAGRLDQMVKNTGEPISPRDALEALRRGIIPEDSGADGPPSYMKAVRQSRLRDEWGPVLAQLQWVPLPPSDAVDAVVEGQIDYAQGEAAARISGVNAEDFRILVNTRGRPPSPGELQELLRRGLIPREGVGPDQTSFQQGIYEGASKDKWWQHYAALAEYIPPPRTVTALLREGVLSKDKAAELFTKSGLTPELAQTYVASASHQKLQHARDLALSTVLDLYESHAFDEKTATGYLEHLGYDAQEAGYLLVLRDLQRSLKAHNQALTRVGALYVARKLTSAQVRQALTALDVPDARQGELLAVWELERQATVRVLTEGQITSAVYYKVLTVEQGIAYLVALGYSAYDAWVAVSVRLHGPQGTPPPAPTVPTEAAV
jgi:hypothetical protein